MRRVLTGYAVSFNRRYKRHGQLFQNRYKSIICQEDVYLKELVRYIHLNPLRAKIVSDISELNTYAYCGHSVIMDKKKRSWQDMGYILSFFGKSLRESRKRYLQYVESGIEQGRRPELVGGGLIRSLGGWKAVKNARFSGQDRMKDTIEQKVCEIFGIEPDEIYSKSRQKTRAEARGLYCYWAVVALGYSLADLARLLGMTGQGVGMLCEGVSESPKQKIIDL